MIYVVSGGDTLYGISQEFGVPEERIEYDNQLYGQSHLAEGQALYIAAGDAVKIRPMYVTGYAYPYVERTVLQESLPILNELLVFSFGFTLQGALVYPQADDLWLVELAWNYGISPMLVLTPFGPDGKFNNYLIQTIVQDAAIRNTLIQNLLTAVRDRGYAGVDVDFEYILPQDREAYAGFVGELRSVMNANGYIVSVALAPKTSADQPGLIYEGVDYRLLGQNADHVFLMTYEWGYTYGPPMAVAPLNKVREVVDYAVQEIPAQKIIMGIPNYAYDWTLPFTRGTSEARVIGNVEAVQIAAAQGAAIQFDDVAQSPHFTYWENGIQHEVWFEDVRSIEAKLELADAYGLMGVGYWNLMRPFRANWLLLQSLMGK
ncbi:glycosyl hydrolase family 18 protein [Qiania dongpingensis]|uniref:LysM peptidoglycan-binding domain-containing protein n=1 Tax=Qiania dongpingensis TaxID=2763669 RepID=A0A7G9G1K3_9FIRM|nr:glycosyl hydrolase family 18 protein [Qiania dongpingensis]QNM04685.1 LysM peptidoglycan-binding domain-containing protein [Qiania dongpingensis]